MFSNLTYKTKNLYLAIGLVLFLVLAYLITIKNTISLVNENQKISLLLNSPQNNVSSVRNLQQKQKKMQLIIANYEEDKNMGEEFMMSQVSDYCHKNQLVLKKFTNATLYKADDLVIFTKEITTTGGYINLLKLVYYLEKSQELGRVASVKFYLDRDFKLNKEFLQATIYLQTLDLSDK